MRAMQLPTADAVLGDFSNVSFQHFDDTYTFTTRDSTFVVVANGDSLDVAYTFGHFPLQQVLLPAHGGRLQALTVAWDVQKKEWYSLYPDEPTPDGDDLNWKSEHLNWNYMCADCHSTGLDRGYDLKTDTYSTTWEEMTIGCEACHGPAKAHVDWAERPKGDDPFAVNVRAEVVPGVGRPTMAALELDVNTCARCHSRRVALDESFDHNGSFLDQYAPSLLEDSLYFADGQIREEVYVYGSFMQSKMAQKGVTCVDCHDPHSGKIKLPGNALCSSCHESATYDTALHSGHQVSRDGAIAGAEKAVLNAQVAAIQCVSCHMPERTYMGVDPRRDHRFGIPDPLLSAELGSPDVCASCHPDKSASWAAGQIDVLRTSEMPVRNLAARAARAVSSQPQDAPMDQLQDAMSLVQTALRDSLTASINKASLLARLGQIPNPESVRMVMLGLGAESAMERVGALRAVSEWAGLLPAPDFERLFVDSTKWVRLEAVSTALAFGETSWSGEVASKALAEYVASQQAVAERPEAHVNLGRMYENLNNADGAQKEFETMVRIDSTSANLWLELALFRGREAGRRRTVDPASYQEWRNSAEQAFKSAAMLESPLRSDILYMFGLFLADDRPRMPDAANVLKEASRLDPDHPRKAYNAGLAFQQLGVAPDAEALLRRAVKAGDLNANDALIILFMQNERWDEAQILNDQLITDSPNRTELLERRAYIASEL